MSDAHKLLKDTIPRRGSFTKRSTRQGASSLDKDSLEKVQWYKEVQEKIFRKEEAKDLRGLEQSTPRVDDTNEQTVATNVGEAKPVPKTQEEKKAELLKKMSEKPKFGGLALSMGAESSKKKEDSEKRSKDRNRVKKPDPEYYTKPKDFNPRKWLRIMRTPNGPVNARVILFPWLSGNTDAHLELAEILQAKGIETYAVLLPGRSFRVLEPLEQSVFQITQNVKHAFHDLHLAAEGAPPTILYGHSIGAVLAFELAKELRVRLNISEQGIKKKPGGLVLDAFEVSHLIVSSCRAPNVLSVYNSDRFNIRYFCGSVAELRDVFLKFGLCPLYFQTRNDLITLYLPIFRGDLQLLEKYIYYQEPNMPAPLQCPVTTLGAEDDLTVAALHLEKWREVTSSQENDFVMLKEGGHMHCRNLKTKYHTFEKVFDVCEAYFK
jgi:surfactin synthase thioesterase subunit